MKVKMKSIMSGPEGVALPSQTIDVDENTGKNLVDGDYATLVSIDTEIPDVQEEKPKRGKK